MTRGLTKRERERVKNRIHKMGMTIAGWARVNGFNTQTVNNALNTDYGRGKLTPKAAEIIAKLREV